MEFQNLTFAELSKYDPQKTVVFLPLGTLEEQGQHLPVGLSLFEATAFTKKLSEKLGSDSKEWKTLVFPVAPLCIETHTSRFAVSVRPHVLRDYLVDVCEHLHHYGFRYFICYTGTPGPKQLTTIEEASKILKLKHTVFGFFGKKSAPVLMSVSSAFLDGSEKSLNPFFLDPKEHAGERDTSIALHIQDTSHFNIDDIYQKLPDQALSSSVWERWLSKNRKKTSGYWGKPSQASAEKGATLFEEKLNTLYPKVKAALSGSNEQSLFKSWYSLIPTNKSLFKVWILLFLLMGTSAAWILYNVQAAFHFSDFN